MFASKAAELQSILWAQRGVARLQMGDCGSERSGLDNSKMGVPPFPWASEPQVKAEGWTGESEVPTI